MRGVVIVALFLSAAAGTGCADDPCCTSNDDCVDGAACFEGACALRCAASAMCLDGEVCSALDDGVGVCRAAQPSASTLARCPFGER